MRQDERAYLNEIDGLFIGQLSAEELAVFQAAIIRGDARRSYEGAAGLLGLGKVKVIAKADGK